ncbi:hypothetical protein DYB32_003682 [Aphanomyces invadans]|uniref:Uncharacterized protein n=1 Tax=Aphanomyces invadans TaxID=157072 RepID=A0A418B003_9STRA|nr:hypothetical protein DYB32_003682 [Aphanomyces invadans]
MTGSNHQHTQVALSRLDKSMAALERIRDRILTKRDAYPQNSEKWQRQTMELNAVLSKLQEFQAEKDVVFHPELYSDEQLPYMACFHGVVSALEAFVSSMSPVTSDFLEYTDPKTGNTPLLVACAQGHVECAKILIAVGANVDARNKAGSTALHCACEHGQMDVVAFLLDVPYMNPYTLDRRHHSPLQIARMACLDHDAWTRFKECARLLEEVGLPLVPSLP